MCLTQVIAVTAAWWGGPPGPRGTPSSRCHKPTQGLRCGRGARPTNGRANVTNLSRHTPNFSYLRPQRIVVEDNDKFILDTVVPANSGQLYDLNPARSSITASPPHNRHSAAEFTSRRYTLGKGSRHDVRRIIYDNEVRAYRRRWLRSTHFPFLQRSNVEAISIGKLRLGESRFCADCFHVYAGRICIGRKFDFSSCMRDRFLQPCNHSPSYGCQFLR